MDLGTAFGRIVIDSSGATAGLAKASTGLSMFSKVALGAAAGVGLAFGGLAIGMTSAVGVARDFEAAMSDVASVTDASEAELARLAEQALEVGASTRFSAREAAAGQFELAKAGVEVSEIMGGALPGALALAAAGDIEVADAAAYAANAMNLFGLAGSEVTGIADAFAVAANTTTADVGDFGAALTQGGGAAKAAGLNFLQTMTYLEALAAAGVKGSDAGTSLKTSLLQLLNPTDKQAKLARELGLQFIDANGVMKDAAGISAELRRETGDMTKAERARTLATLAGTDGVRTLLALYDAGPRTLKAWEAGLDEAGAAARTAAERQDNLSGDVEEFGGAIETLQIRVGTALLPMLREAAQGMTAFVASAAESDALADFGVGLEGRIRSTASAIGAAAEAATPLAFALGGMLPEAAETAGLALQAIGMVAVPAGLALLALATYAVDAAAAVLSVVNAVASTPAGMTAMVVALTALTGAYVAVRVASLAAAAAMRVQAIAGAVSAFVSLAASVRNGAAAMALLQAATAGALGPVALAGIAIGAVVGGVIALASGMFRGASPAEVYAQSVGRVADAAERAEDSVTGLRDAISTLANANLGAERAELAVAQALERVREVRRQVADGTLTGTAAVLAERDAVLAVKEARQRQADAASQVADAEAGAATAATDGAAALASLASSQGDAAAKANEARDALRTGLGPLLDTEQAAADLEDSLAGLGDEQLTTAARLSAVRAAAAEAADAIKGTSPAAKDARRALEAVAKATPGQLEQFAADIQAGVDAGRSEAEAGRDAINRLLATTGTGVSADLTSLILSIHSQGAAVVAAAAAVRAAANAELRKINADTRASPSANDLMVASLHTMRRNTARGLGAVLASVETGGQQIIDASRAIGIALENLREQEDRRQARRDARRFAGARGLAVLAGGPAMGKGARGAIGGEVGEAIRAEREAERALAKAAGDEKGRAREVLADARRARAQALEELREFGRTSRMALRTTALEAAQASAEAVQSGIGAVESTLSDFAGRAGTAIQTALAETLRAIDTGPVAQRIAAIEADLAGSRAGREDRDAARRGADLGKTAEEAAAKVARMQAALAGASTDSERQAAGTLLAAALAEQQTADQELADHAEDERLRRLERERQSLAEQLQVQRDNATALADARRAALDRELGDLAEGLRNREITLKQFNERLGAIAGDPALAADLATSGRVLGLSFTRGIQRSLRAAEGAAKELAAAVAKYLRLRSPAEAGPLRHDFARSGRTIGTDLAAGLRARRALVATEAERMAAAAALAGARAAGGGGADPAAWARSGDTYVIHAERPVEDAALIADRVAWHRRYGRG